MMITVSSGSASCSRACSSMPSMPGILMSMQRDVEFRLLDDLQRLARAGHRPRRVAFAGEPLAQRIAHHQFVVDDQDSSLRLRSQSGLLPLLAIGSSRSRLPLPSVPSVPVHCLTPAVGAAAAGSTTLNSVPSPGAERTEISPACCSTMLCATARPRPVRFWSSLVVKNGSKMRGSTSSGMPQPVSFTRTTPCSADAVEFRGSLPACRPWAWPPTRSPSAPEPPAGSGWRRTPPAAGPPPGLLQLDRSACPACASPAATARCTTVFRSFGSRLARRLARERQQVLHQVAAALALALDGLNLLRHARRGRRTPASARSRSTSRAYVRMPNSGLLISCATVAASLPMDAIFSELSSVLWTRSSSAVLRRTSLFDLAPARPATSRGHLVEGARQVAQFVVRPHRQPVRQVAVRPRGACRRSAPSPAGTPPPT